MKNHAWTLALGPVLMLAACNNPDTAVFVTSSSIGINVDSKPPTASIAYDRVEGFIGPRFESGAAPAVVASMETAGTVFNPQIRQTYATGAAANIATEVKGAKDEVSPDLKGATRLMFFGTGTTLGLKVGFGPEGAPDSIVLGYRRKEISVIPLGIMPPQPGTATTPAVEGKAVYPSVLASIDTTSTMTVMGQTGLATKQFFATGRAAEALAQNPAVTIAFKAKSAASLLDGLSDEQKKQDKAVVDAIAVKEKQQVSVILAAVTCNGKLDPGSRDKLAADAGYPALRKTTTLEDFRLAFDGNPSITEKLFNAASKNTGGPTCPQQ
jgi:hypothetical protein